jgi:hypothetical protein
VIQDKNVVACRYGEIEEGPVYLPREKLAQQAWARKVPVQPQLIGPSVRGTVDDLPLEQFSHTGQRDVFS